MLILRKTVSIEIVKKGDDGKLLEGAEFNLEDTNGKVIATQNLIKMEKLYLVILKKEIMLLKKLMLLRDITL